MSSLFNRYRMNKLYFSVIRFSLGIEEGKEFLDGSALKNFDWQAL